MKPGHKYFGPFISNSERVEEVHRQVRESMHYTADTANNAMEELIGRFKGEAPIADINIDLRHNYCLSMRNIDMHNKSEILRVIEDGYKMEVITPNDILTMFFRYKEIMEEGRK